MRDDMNTIAEAVIDLYDRQRRRPEKDKIPPIGSEFLDAFLHKATGFNNQALVLAGTRDGKHIAERRCILQSAQLKFGTVKRVVILCGGLENGLIFRREGLDNGAPGFFAASAASDDLRDEGKAAFSRTIITCVKTLIRRDNAYKRYILEIQSLCDHLRADKHRNLLFPELLEELFMRAYRRNGIRVHAQDLNPRETLMQFFFYKLRAAPMRLRMPPHSGQAASRR